VTGRTPDRSDKKEDKMPAAQRWAGVVQRHPVLAAVLSAVLILALAAPARAIKLSFPDESAQARGTMGYASYATMAQGFGPGFDAPLIVTAQVPPAGEAALDSLGKSAKGAKSPLTFRVVIEKHRTQASRTMNAETAQAVTDRVH
jgi:uncharacterized membrane protein YdfJ with MMPL/SSD domain